MSLPYKDMRRIHEKEAARPAAPLVYKNQDFAKFDSIRSKVQYIDEQNHFDLYIVDYKSLFGFFQNPQIYEIRYHLKM
jgi:hypothetical protein